MNIHDFDAVLENLRSDLKLVLNEIFGFLGQVALLCALGKSSTRGRTAHHKYCPIHGTLELRRNNQILPRSQALTDSRYSGRT